MVPDVSEVRVNNEENEAEIKLLKRIGDMKAKATQLYGKWRKYMLKGKLALKTENQRISRLTFEQLEKVDPKKMTFEDLEWFFNRHQDL